MPYTHMYANTRTMTRLFDTLAQEFDTVRASVKAWARFLALMPAVTTNRPALPGLLTQFWPLAPVERVQFAPEFIALGRNAVAFKW